MTTRSLAEQFADLQDERERTWTAAQLENNAHQRRVLVEQFDPTANPGVGDSIEPFELIDSGSRRVSSRELLNDGPAVIIFFRFGGCPACNIALPYYNETLWPAVSAAGIPLLAVSAQIPVDSGPAERHGLHFPTYSDPEYALGRQLGLTFFPENQPFVNPGDNWIGATLGTNSYEITKPAVIVLNSDHTIRFIDVSPDWLVRTETSVVLEHLPETQAEKHKSRAA